MHHKGRTWEGIPSEARVLRVQCKERIPKQIIFDLIWDIYSFHELKINFFFRIKIQPTSQGVFLGSRMTAPYIITVNGIMIFVNKF